MANNHHQCRIELKMVFHFIPRMYIILCVHVQDDNFRMGISAKCSECITNPFLWISYMMCVCVYINGILSGHPHDRGAENELEFV